jgi:hypothetical protein
MIQLQKHLQFLDIRLHNPLVWRGNDHKNTAAGKKKSAEN